MKVQEERLWGMDFEIAVSDMGEGGNIMHRLGQKVIIVEDQFEQGLPLGSYGYIIAYERNPDNAFDYLVRIPSLNKHVYVPQEDIALEETLLREAAELVEKEALLDFALMTRNEQLFRQVMNQEEEADDRIDASPAQQAFIRQINLRAWI